jgi:hypothetical protein
MSTTNVSPKPGELGLPQRRVVTANPFTLRDLYVRASISGNSLVAELGRYLNIDETTFASSLKGGSEADGANDEACVNERALAAILEVVTSNSKAAFEYVRIPEPAGGVREWWTRMLSGSMNNSQTISISSATGESK